MNYRFTIYKKDFDNNGIIFKKFFNEPISTRADAVGSYIKYRFLVLRTNDFYVSVYDLLDDIGVLESYLVCLSNFPSIKDEYGWKIGDKLNFKVIADPCDASLTIIFYDCSPIFIKPSPTVCVNVKTATINPSALEPCKIGPAADALPEIKKVIYNGPATIVIWADGTKTVVKCCESDAYKYSEEAGLAFAIMKKYYGKKFKRQFKKWCPKEKEPKEKTKLTSYEEGLREVGKTIERSFRTFNDLFKVCNDYLDKRNVLEE